MVAAFGALSSASTGRQECPSRRLVVQVLLQVLLLQVLLLPLLRALEVADLLEVLAGLLDVVAQLLLEAPRSPAGDSPPVLSPIPVQIRQLATSSAFGTRYRPSSVLFYLHSVETLFELSAIVCQCCHRVVRVGQRASGPFVIFTFQLQLVDVVFSCQQLAKLFDFFLRDGTHLLARPGRGRVALQPAIGGGRLTISPITIC